MLDKDEMGVATLLLSAVAVGCWSETAPRWVGGWRVLSSSIFDD